jgi:hypothetical protein
MATMLFAPFLIAFYQQGLLRAMRQSLMANLRNIGPFLIYTILVLLLGIVVCFLPWLLLWLLVPTLKSFYLQSLMAMVTLAAAVGLSLILTAPYFNLTFYFCFEDLFEKDALPESPDSEMTVSASALE